MCCFSLIFLIKNILFIININLINFLCMKKKFLFMLLALSCAFSSSAFAYDDDEDSNGVQDRRSSVFKLGPKVGVNFSHMSKFQDADLGQGMGVGFEVGLAAQLHFGRKRGADAGTGPLGVQLEAFYAANAVKTSDKNISLKYLQVPVLLKYFVIPNLSIEAGPTICFPLSASPDMISDKANLVNIPTGNLKAKDVKITLGVSFESKAGFYASARYNIGLSKMAEDFPCKMSVISLNVGWLFNIAKF